MLIKRTLCFVHEVTSDAGEIIEPALRKVAVAGVIDNPFAGRFESDLSPLVKASEQIGREICKLAIALSHRTSRKDMGRAPSSASTANRSTAMPCSRPCSAT